MDIGKFDRPMMVRRPVYDRRDDGSDSLSYRDLGLHYVFLSKAGISRWQAAPGSAALVTYRARLRSAHIIDHGWQLVEGTRKFRVIGRDDTSARRGWVEYVVVEEQ